MLFQINSPATESNSVIVLHPSDSVGVARVVLNPGPMCRGRGRPDIRQLSYIPAGHKIALAPIRVGDAVLRYGEIIGFALQDIAPGEHVHEHNLGFEELDHPVTFDTKPEAPVQSTRSFIGFRRGDGRVGTRNYIAVVATSNCAAHAVELVEKSFYGEQLPPNVDGIVSFPHGDGCGQAMGADTRQLQRTLEGVLDHPNVAAAVVIGLGCEVNQI